MLCLKPETSEMQQKRFHAIVKVKKFFHVFLVSQGECSVKKKIDILGPGVERCLLLGGSKCISSMVQLEVLLYSNPCIVYIKHSILNCSPT